MSVWSLACQQSVFQRYHSEIHLSEFYPQDGGESQLASKLRHCHPMYMVPWAQPQSPSKILIGSAALAQLMVMFNRETDTSRPRNGTSVTIGRIFALRACDAAEDFWLLKAYGVFTRCNRRSDRWRNRRRDRSHVCLHAATVGAIIGATIGAIVGATGRADSWMSV